ncbi:hypothetical protein EDB81DRAFT_765777 [Dactylonectria macrodidyma]|uniref:Uncharacterized protein n=1 Tax=Dactylonectria macrodidyma TaxID=307937 RepID=A0A9P9IL46_9HYPO|nr:hypothetical protein EDB81DRAFT_765777 [Dactylonectria macrodidyma]
MERIFERYQQVMSSPTLEAITNVRNREVFKTDRLSRLEKYGKRKKPGARVRPRGDFVTSVGFSDIQAQHEASKVAAEVKEQRSQLRSTRTIILREMKALKAQWREENESRLPQGQPRLTWNKWLDESENRPRFLTLEAQRKEHNGILSQPPKRAFSEAQEQARHALRPIIAMDQSAWPDSDDEIEFRGLGPFQDDDDDVDLIGLEDLDGEGVVGAETPLGITSSPPLDPLDPAADLDDDNLTVPQLPVTTPRISGYQRVKNVLRDLRQQQAFKAARATSS